MQAAALAPFIHCKGAGQQSTWYESTTWRGQPKYSLFSLGLGRYLQPASGAIFDVGIIAFRTAAIVPVTRGLRLRLDLHGLLLDIYGRRRNRRRDGGRCITIRRRVAIASSLSI